MPYKDPQKRQEYNKSQNKDWYRRNREHHIAKVRERKIKEYGGECLVCGARTMGSSKNDPPPKYCKDHRREQWDEKLVLEREEKVKEATRRVPESRKQYVPKITQEKLAQTSYRGLAFSRLKHSADRDRDEKNENPPAPRKWASP